MIQLYLHSPLQDWVQDMKCGFENLYVDIVEDKKKKYRCLGENTEGLKCDNEKKLVKVT